MASEQDLLLEEQGEESDEQVVAANAAADMGWTNSRRGSISTRFSR